jgi:beta-RFAP synthase
MIDAPGLRLIVQESDSLAASGPLHERALEFTRRVFRTWQLESDAACRILVESAPREHVGLGVGTQLALAVSAGLHALFQRAAPSAADLARCVGRGERSAIGSHGFLQGGLLVEAGKYTLGEISPLVARMELPSDWRFVLICPAQQSGLSGLAERQAFDRLPPVPREVTSQLCTEALLHLLPAAATADFGRFSQGLYRFGHLAGMCFAPAQAGPYATVEARGLVQLIRTLGVEGVGQSSWGPTLFALLPDEAAAGVLVAELARHTDCLRHEFIIAAPANRGAEIRFES